MNASQNIVVWKFGGSTLRDAASLRRVATLIAEEQVQIPRPPRRTRNDKAGLVIVCSALTGVTDQLARAVEHIRRRQFRVAQRELAQVCARHLAVLAELRPPANHPALGDVQRLIARLQDAVHTAAESRAGAVWAAQVLSCGESLSARLLAIALERSGAVARAVDASEIIVTTADFECAAPLWDETRGRVHAALPPLLDGDITPIVTGFFGATLDGRITLLGRNSSDYSATIIAHALDAVSVCLWKDVDGFFTADPKRNGEAEFLRELSYEDAKALLTSGARVVDPRALGPLQEKGIPVFIRNVERPRAPGTRIADVEQTFFPARSDELLEAAS